MQLTYELESGDGDRFAIETAGPEKRLLNEDGSAQDRIVGFETEYAVNARGIEGYRHLEHLSSNVALVGYRGNHRDPYMANYYNPEDGDREYMDVGPHPEISTAEDVSFVAAAFRVARGHVKMARRYEDVLEKGNASYRKAFGKDIVERVDIFANTCEPNSTNSWGSHRNYLASRSLELSEYGPPLAVHHAARIVCLGVGLVLPGPNHGSFKYVLSEKAEHIYETIGPGTVRDRPLVNTRDEPLADAGLFRRIHDVSGETAMNPFVNALSLAQDDIILRAVELGVSFDDLMLDNPVQAMRSISHDPSLKTTVSLEDGRKFTGLDLEEEFAVRSIDNALARDYLTPQGYEWGMKWLKLISDLRGDPDTCLTRVDWVLKRELIERGLLAKRKSGQSDYHVASSIALNYHNILNEGVGMGMLRKGRFELSPTGDQLEHGLPLPPTRAKLRSETIATLEKLRESYGINWGTIKLVRIMRTVRLGDPYALEDERLQNALDKGGYTPKATAPSGSLEVQQIA